MMHVLRELRKQAIYKRMTREVLLPIRRFWRDHEERHLDRAMASVDSILDGRSLVVPEDSDAVSSSTSIRITGWYPPQREFHLSARQLRRNNPGYRVSVRRFKRKDILMPWFLGFWRAGFLVVAQGKRDLPGFSFGLAHNAGYLATLPTTNDDATFAARFLRSSMGTRPVVTEAGRVPRGKVDEIIFTSTLEPRDKSSWIRALAHVNPLEMLELVESPQGRSLAKPLARSLELTPSSARWRDRFALSAGFVGEAPHSDLQMLKVVRPLPASQPGEAFLPVLERHGDVARASAGQKRLPAPSSDWLHLAGGAVQDGGTVTVSDQLIVYENAADPTLDFVAGHFGRVLGSRATPDYALITPRPKALGVISEGILLAGRNDANWYHWVIEYLPRVLAIEKDVDDSVPLIVSNRTPQSGIDALRSLSSRPIVKLDPNFTYEFEMLHVAAPPVQVLDSTRVPWSAGLYMNPQPLRAMRSVWRADAGTASRKIFLRRKSGHRGMNNEHVLERIAHRLGLEVVDPGGLSWVQQQELFASAKLVVGASGAVMANYLLMPQGSRVLALTAESLADFVLPAAIADVADVHFSYLLGATTRNIDDFLHRRDWLHGSFSITAESFEAAVRAELELVG